MVADGVGARVGEPQAVDEVMQEVSLAVVRGQAPIADRSKIAPWLYQLAVRQSLLYRRKMGGGENWSANMPSGSIRPSKTRRTADPLDWLLAEERQRLVRQAIGPIGAPRFRNPAAEIHRRLELSRIGGAYGR